MTVEWTVNFYENLSTPPARTLSFMLKNEKLKLLQTKKVTDRFCIRSNGNYPHVCTKPIISYPNVKDHQYAAIAECKLFTFDNAILYIAHDDGVTVICNGKILYNFWRPTPARGAKIKLPSWQDCDIKVYWFDGGGVGVLSCSVENPLPKSPPKVTIPADYKQHLINLFNYLMSKRNLPENHVIRSCSVFIPGNPTVLREELKGNWVVHCYGPHGILQSLTLDWTILPPGKYMVEMGVSYQQCSQRDCYAQSYVIKLDENFSNPPNENCSRLLWTAPVFYHGWIMRWSGRNKAIIDVDTPFIIGVFASWLKIYPIRIYYPKIKLIAKGNTVTILSNIKTLAKLTINGKVSYIWLTGKNMIKVNETGKVVVCCDLL